MKKVFTVISCLTLIILTSCCNQGNSTKDNRVLPYRIVDKEKAIKLYLSNDECFNSLFKECSDILDAFGENTKYITDPEECMVDNFSYALVNRLDGQMKYNNPNIIEGILKILK